MKKITSTCIITVLAVAYLYAQEQAPEVHEEWRLRKDADGVRVFTRWIDASGTRKARQMRIEMTAEANPEDVVAVIRSDRDARKWVYRAKKYYSFDHIDGETWYTYTEMSVPWPFNNRDLVLRNQLEWSADRNSVLITLAGVPDHIAEENNLKRIEHFDGSWSIDRVAPDSVRVRYEVFTKSEPVLPRWVIDPIIEQGFWDTLYKMRETIEEYSNNAVARRQK